MFRSVEKQHLKVPAHIDYLGDLRDFVTQIGRKHKFSEKVVNAFKLSIDEAATNIIRHAYRHTEGLITLRAIVKKNSLTISIIDQGMYFDPRRVKDPDLNRYIDIGKKGGLGIFIMRKLMDEIDYRKTEEGNELRITKFRDKPAAKKRFFKSVGNIPFSIKAKYFFRAISIVTFMIAIGYLYFFLKTDDELIADFLSASHSTNRAIVTRIGAAPASEFAFPEDIVYPIEEEYRDKIARISIEDSMGVIAYSSNVSEIQSQFKRPEKVERLTPTVYKYSVNLSGDTYYEFETPIVIKELNIVYGKAHIYFSARPIESQISSIRLDSLQLALLILGMSYAGVALLIYLVMNPFRKLSEWIKDLGHNEEMEDDVDIDASTEIGEIARAFSDIQTKFRDSQKNLADQERLQREMQVAQEIQQTLLPTDFPELEGYQLSAYYEAAKEVGGDYYDFVEVDKDTLGIAVADVSGKGVPGSLVMTMIRTALRTEARGIKDAAEVLSRVNAFVSNDIKKGMFVTVFYLIIDSKRRRLNYASAGHNPMILYRGSTEQTYYLNPKGFPIGVQLPDRDYFRKYIESDTIQLAKDDILLLYTDGITEAMNSHRDLFGEERLQKVLNDYGDMPASQFVERLKDSIYGFTEGAPQYDDITLVAIKEESTREEDELRRAKEVHKLISEGMTIKDACQQINLTTYAYYNKYKKVFEEQGTEAFEIDEGISVESKHLSIEEKSKIFDIIQNHPEYGAARIKEELNTKKYHLTDIIESRIYEELVRSRLNTKALREAFINRAKRNKRRIKAPGTPFMTLDGKVVLKENAEPDYSVREPAEEPAPHTTAAAAEPAAPIMDESPEAAGDGVRGDDVEDTVFSEFEAETLINSPLEDVLAKTEKHLIEDFTSEKNVTQPKTRQDNLEGQQQESEPDPLEISSEAGVNIEDFPQADEDASLLEDFSFEELFTESSQIADVDEDDFDVSQDEIEQELPVSGPDDSDESSAEHLAVESELEPGIAAETDQVQPEWSEEADSEDSAAVLSSTSVEELLDDTQFEEAGSEGDGFSEIVDTDNTLEAEVDTDSTLEAETVQDEEVEEEEEENTVSFSELIQAIDEEIVYVKDAPPVTEGLDENEETLEDAGAVVIDDGGSASTEREGGNGQPSKTNGASNQLSSEERETILINGIKHYKNNEYEKAIDEFKKVINIYPDYKEAHSILGNAYFRNKMYNEAAVEYQKVKDIDPGDITAYENMGVIYANRGEYRQAVSEWKKVIELSPERADIEDKIRKALRLL